MKSMYNVDETLMKMAPASYDGGCAVYNSLNYVQSSAKSPSIFVVKGMKKSPRNSK